MSLKQAVMPNAIAGSVSIEKALRKSSSPYWLFEKAQKFVAPRSMTIVVGGAYELQHEQDFSEKILLASMTVAFARGDIDNRYTQASLDLYGGLRARSCGALPGHVFSVAENEAIFLGFYVEQVASQAVGRRFVGRFTYVGVPTV